jgi:heterodisulfide reductase subunit B
MMDHLLAQALAARNLREAARVGAELLAPCPSCYQREKNAELEIHEDDSFRAQVNALLDSPYTSRVTVYALPEFLIKFVGEEKIASLVKTDLSRLRVVPYYGCLLGRPAELTGERDIEQPMMMDLLLQAAGADVKWWNYKTECCGASVGLPKMEIQRRLSGKILEQALAAGADAIVVACPLCHVNLDLKQAQINKYLGTDYNVPILYLSQVLGLALGLTEDDVMLGKNVVDARGLVKRAIAEAAAAKAEEERKAAEKATKAAARASAAKEAAEAEAAVGAAGPADVAAGTDTTGPGPVAAGAPGASQPRDGEGQP